VLQPRAHDTRLSDITAAAIEQYLADRLSCGKFDEELARMSDIVDRLTPNSMLLFNEPFAATNEREGRRSQDRSSVPYSKNASRSST
jgi:hypothetical protein